MNKNIQPGTIVEVKGEVEKLVLDAEWRNMIYGVEDRYFLHLMGEYYCNMKPIRGLDCIMHLTTIMGGKPILVDHKTLNKALHLPHRFISLPCVDIYSHFVFCKEEFQLYVGFFTDSDVPFGICDSNCGIHYKHFTPMYQLIALILRSNVLTKPNQDKHFDFFDLKFMFLFVTNRIDFSISYVILLNMINAHLVDYMPYGQMLTSVFGLFHLPLPTSLETKNNSYISVTHVRTQIPLDKCETQVATHSKFIASLQEEDVFLADNGSFMKMFEEQKLEMKRIKDENIAIINRVTYLEGIAATLGGARQMDIDIGNLYQVQMSGEGTFIDDIDMFHEIEAVGVGIGGQSSKGFTDLGTGSFMAAMEEALQ
ncbi:uncharacterized protein LOC108203959 [Daucus carota subsp. sativus]|uniref:uncharacterized protein LOC108203959 n=1 Tax=Daucus carota subsp. sativus TaxID=79200 RepID=UPI0030837713